MHNVLKAFMAEPRTVESRIVFETTIANAERDVNVRKGILKRRIRKYEKQTAEPLLDCGGESGAVVSKRNVTFDETIMVKNDKDLVVKKPLKLELVIENWKSGSVKTTPSETIKTDPGIVRRLVQEFNTIQEPLTDNLEIDHVEQKIMEDNVSIETEIPLCETLETVDLTVDG